VRDTWDLIGEREEDSRAGQLLLILLVGTALSLAFMAVGEPYWILVGAFAGIVEIVPVIGPLAAGALAIGAGFTDSWHTAPAAGLCSASDLWRTTWSCREFSAARWACRRCWYWCR
jgi:predicted PurR-regulated permease PerM